MMLAGNAMTLIAQRRTKHIQATTGSRVAIVGFFHHCLLLPEITGATKRKKIVRSRETYLRR